MDFIYSFGREVILVNYGTATLYNTISLIMLTRLA